MDTLKKKYAQLILEKGLCLHKGQSLRIKCEYQQYDFARLVATLAYKMGALRVEIDLKDIELERVKLENQEIESYAKLPQYMSALYDDMEINDWAFLSIDTTEGRHFMEGSDISKTVALSKSLRKISKKWHDSLNKNINPWCVVCVPGPIWAKQVLGDNATEEDLWNLIAPILKLDQEDPSKAWEEDSKSFYNRMDYLNSLKIEELKYISDSCNLSIGFHEDALWIGGPSSLPNGDKFYPNLPTAEIFSVPDIRKCEGFVKTTKPVSVLGVITEGVTFNFKNGKVVDFTAERGEDAIENFLEIDKGARFLGEVALVDEDSPIAKSNKIFSSILYDENASCHLALGSCYPECLNNLKDDPVQSKNGNESEVHVDFMVGSSSLNIDAKTRNGKIIRIMEKGHFLF